MSTNDPAPPTDLSALSPDYEIVGELNAAGGTRNYLANRTSETGKRRDDQAGVLITVVPSPAGDEANALEHLASDTQLLTRLTHRRLVPVLDGRWIGKEAFAVVTQRLNDPTLAQKLATREQFTNPRIAAILREVNTLLEWAREQKIVHRTVIADRIFLEPKTDRVRVSFSAAPILRLHPSTARDDARTIARLAMAMLTGTEDTTSYEGETLAELRTDLPVRLNLMVQALLQGKPTEEPTDVTEFIALIGMADPVAEGESERDRIRLEILEEQRVEREKLAAERAAFEKESADAKALFERESAEAKAKFDQESHDATMAFAKSSADARSTLERENADLKSRLEREHAAAMDRIARERADLEKAVTAEREALQRAVTKERADLEAKRTELNRAIAKERADIERAAADDRRQIAELRAKIERAGELEIERKREAALADINRDEDVVLDEGELATPSFMPPMVVPFQEFQFDRNAEILRDDPIVFEPEHEDAAMLEQSGEVAVVPVGGRRPEDNRKWLVPGVVVGVVVLLAGSAIAYGVSNRSTTPSPASRPAPSSAAAVVAPAPVPVPAPVQPAAMDPAPAAAPAPAVALLPASDSAVLASARWLDSIKEVEIENRARVARRAAAARRAAEAVAARARVPVNDTARASSISIGDTLLPPP